MDYLLAALAVAGHWATGIFVINRLHATALPHRLMKVVDLLWYVDIFLVPTAALGAYFLLPGTAGWLEAHPLVRGLLAVYVLACCGAALLAVLVWRQHLTDAHTTWRMEANHTVKLDAVQQIGHRPSNTLSTSLLSRLPGNQVFELWVQEKSLRLPRLDPALDGLTIAHLSDLHLTGRVTPPYYDLIVEQANQLQPDLMVISGDIIDKRKCFPWLSTLLGRLRARHGVYFVLGNHDLRVRNEMGLRDELTRCGLVDLGGRFQVIEIRGCPVLLAGNELPWFVPAADMQHAPDRLGQRRPFRIAVAHSPDQIEWSRRHDFDLMLAGHTHGGQIRFPVIGPVFAPSRYGVKYCAGTFFSEPTLMHVSRGLCGTRPLRFNCAPELAKLVLRSETATG